jgi:hypothetical protein
MTLMARAVKRPADISTPPARQSRSRRVAFLCVIADAPQQSHDFEHQSKDDRDFKGSAADRWFSGPRLDNEA